jgi:hypothetical protein
MRAHVVLRESTLHRKNHYMEVHYIEVSLYICNLFSFRKGIKLAHTGPCSTLTIADDCPESCPGEDSPACGSDGNVYRNWCEMKRLTCGQRVVEVPLHHCRTTELCNRTCDGPAVAVCGSDGRLYRNECLMRAKNCG